MKTATGFDQQWDEFIDYMKRRAIRDPRALFLSMCFQDRNRSKRWALQLVNLLLEETMARGKTSKDVGAQNGAWAGSEFVTVNLGGVDLATIRAAYSDDAAVWEELEHMVMSQYKISFSFNPATNSVLCSMTCRADGDPNEGKTLVSFAGGWYDALLVSLYKHKVVAKGNWAAVSKDGTFNYG